MDEVKLPQEKFLCRMIKISMNGSLHWLTWKRNIFVFDVKIESYFFFPFVSPTFKGNDSKDIGLVEYKEKLVLTYIDRESDFMKI